MSDALLDDRVMPIQLGADLTLRRVRGERPTVVSLMPWPMLAHAEAQCARNHGGQDLAKIAQRGGFDAVEALCVLIGIPWAAICTEEQAHRILYLMIVLFNRGQRVAEARAVLKLAGGAGVD